jgi:hypothetical protein
MQTKLTLVLAAIGCAGAAQAAEKIRYEEIPEQIVPFGSVIAYRGITVTTDDGVKHFGRRLRLEPDHVRVFRIDNSWEDLGAGRVSRIEIRPTWRYVHHIGDNAVLGMIPFAICEYGSACVLALVFAPPFLIYAAVSAPVYLAADAVTLLLPPKIYEIVH